jgi:hypothetical protein
MISLAMNIVAVAVIALAAIFIIGCVFGIAGFLYQLFTGKGL